MNRTQEAAIAAIEKQQTSHAQYSPAWTVGEQWKDICRAEPLSAELILSDLAVPEMSIAEAEKKIKAAADKKKKGNFAFVSPMEADGILRKFYGLREHEQEQTAAPTAAGVIDLEDFL